MTPPVAANAALIRRTDGLCSVVRIDAASILLPTVAGLATGLGMVWVLRAGDAGTAAVGVVGLATSGLLAARLADPARPWPGVLLAGLAAGLAAALPVALYVDFWTNFCILDCGPPDHGPALRWGGGILTGTLGLHAVAGWLVPRPQRASSPMPDLPE